ncbi:MAG: hypothetical protein Q9170_004485 [Blastenia crenularia]
MTAIFTSITANSAFAANITELVYDARLFRPSVAKIDEYTRLYMLGFPSANTGIRMDDESEGENAIDEGRVDEDEEIVGDGGDEAWVDEDEETAPIQDTDDLPMSDDGFYELGYDSEDEAQFDMLQTSGDVTRSHQRYNLLMEGQVSIFESHRDAEVLSEGMSRLPHLKRILVLDKFQAPIDFLPLTCKPSDWYHEWSLQPFKGIAPPTQWSEEDHLLDPRHMEWDHWDFRGIAHLMTAAAKCAPKLDTMILGCDLSKLSWELYEGKLSPIAPRLTTLKLSCTIPYVGHDEQIGLAPIGRISKTLQELTSLEELYLTLEMTAEPWNPVLQALKLPHLRVLDLGDGLLKQETYECIAEAHADSLSEMRLRNMNLPHDENWEEVAEAFVDICSLDLIFLSSMASESHRELTGTPYLESDDTLEIAQKFMSWIDKDEDKHTLDNRKGGVVIWHLQNFATTGAKTLDKIVSLSD